MSEAAGSVMRWRNPQRGGFSAWFGRDALPPEALAFQDPIDEICERPAPRLLRGVHYLAMAMVAALLAVGALVKVDVVVVASGRIATATPPVVLQPMERGIIREVRVQPGDVVHKGEVLATLDPTFAAADDVSARRQLRTAQAEMRRLQAELNGRPFLPPRPADIEDSLQETLFQERAAEYATRLAVFDADIARLQAELRTTEDGHAALGRELAVAREVEDMRAELLHAQTGSKLHLLEAQSERLHAERDEQTAADHARELEHSVAARIAERQAFIDGWRRDLLESLVTAQTEATRLGAQLAKADRLKQLVVITAPVDGVVLDVAARTADSVLREAEPLLTIVPNDAPLIAEVMIASADVGDTRVGADVALKIDAYPYTQYGMAQGRLLSVGEESFGAAAAPASGRGGAFHRGRIALQGVRLAHMPAGARLFPGMTLTAEIKAGSRSVLAYFLYPLARGLSESVREP